MPWLVIFAQKTKKSKSTYLAFLSNNFQKVSSPSRLRVNLREHRETRDEVWAGLEERLENVPVRWDSPRKIIMLKIVIFLKKYSFIREKRGDGEEKGNYVNFLR